MWLFIKKLDEFFAVIEMYPLCPGKDEYIKFDTIADEIEIQLESIEYE